MDNNNTGNTAEVEIDIIKLLFVFLRKWWVFVLLGLVGLGIALSYSLFYLTPLYESSVSFYVNNRLSQIESADYVSGSDISTSRSLVATYITISSSDRVLNAVSKALDGQFSTTYLNSVVKSKQQGQTELFTVTVTTTDPERSALIANTIADVFPSVLSEIVEGSSARVIDYARIPEKQSFPSHTKNAAIGLLIGIVVAGIIVMTGYLTDVRIMDEEDLSSVTDYPLLGRIPDFATLGKNGIKKYKYGYGDDGKKETPKHSDDAKESAEAEQDQESTGE